MEADQQARWNDVVLSDIHHVSISRPYQVAQNKSAWQGQTCSTHTLGWNALIIIITIIVIQPDGLPVL